MYSIRGTSYDLFKSYLSNRMQYVIHNCIRSSLNKIQCGVLQGSVFGPVLFLLYINDLPNIYPVFKPILFADDTTLIFNDNSIINLENKIKHGIDKLYSWLNINKLSLNIKTNILLFNIRNTNDNVKFKLKICDTDIKIVNKFKFLILIIYNKLDLNSQIDYLCSQLSRAISILNKVKFKLNNKTLILLYNAFFYSHLNYCFHIWGNTFITKLNKINILQKRALKTIYNCDKIYIKCYTQHNSLKFTDSIKLNTTKFMFRAKHHSLPLNLQNIFEVKAYDIILFHIIRIRTQ